MKIDSIEIIVDPGPVEGCEICKKLTSQTAGAASVASGRARGGSKPMFVSGEVFRANYDLWLNNSRKAALN